MEERRNEERGRTMGESEEAEVTSGGPPVVVAEVSLMEWSRDRDGRTSLRH